MDKAQEENTKSSSSSSSSSSLSSSCRDDKSKESAQSAEKSRCSDSNPSERSAGSQSHKSKQPKNSAVPNKKKGEHNFKIIQWTCLQVSLRSSLPGRLCWVWGRASRPTSTKASEASRCCHDNQGEQKS